MDTPVQIPLSSQAFLQRIRRRIESDGSRLRKDRLSDTYFIISPQQAIVESGITTADLLQRFEVLRPWERLSTAA